MTTPHDKAAADKAWETFDTHIHQCDHCSIQPLWPNSPNYNPNIYCAVGLSLQNKWWALYGSVEDTMNWTTPTKKPRYFAGEFTTDREDAAGFVPNLVCKHLHRTQYIAECCAAKHVGWVVYRQQNGRIELVVRPLGALGIGPREARADKNWRNGLS
jgi:hypothetical protein